MSNDLIKKIKVHKIDVNEILFSQYLFSELLSNSYYKIHQNGLRDSWFPERLFHYILYKKPTNQKKTKTQIIHILSKPSWVDFSKTCQLSQFKAKNYLARNCKNQMFFDDQLIILTAYTVSLSYIVTQFWT